MAIEHLKEVCILQLQKNNKDKAIEMAPIPKTVILPMSRISVHHVNQLLKREEVKKGQKSVKVKLSFLHQFTPVFQV